jgi:hypothetical protein
MPAVHNQRLSLQSSEAINFHVEIYLPPIIATDFGSDILVFCLRKSDAIGEWKWGDRDRPRL